MNSRTVWIVLLALAVGAGGGYLVTREAVAPPGPPAASPTAERKPLFYRSPMNPSITSPVPAKDEMGMAYVPVYADSGADTGAPAGTVTIDPVTVQNIGVRTAPVERHALAREIRTVGRVTYDEERLARLHPKTEGWIEKVFVDETGESVSTDTILMSIYSPQLVATQEEYLLALKNARALEGSAIPDIRHGAEALVDSTRKRLRLLDVPEHQIEDLEETGEVLKALHIHSPFDGVAVRVGAREGEYVTPATELYAIADLSRVWVNADVFEQDLPWVKAGDPADIRLKGLPGRVLRGRIDFVYPYAEPKTRTVKVRLAFDNPDGLLRPDLFADVTIHADRRVDALVVPAEAVVRSGAEDRVFVVRAPGKFEPRTVTVGVTASGMTQIVEGVDAGETVVTSAQFLIDSESKLREAAAKMLEAGGEAPAPEMSGAGKGGGEAMGGMDMGGHDTGMKDMPGMAMPRGSGPATEGRRP